MSDESISDPGDTNEGEGAKIVQSSFKEHSVLAKSIAKADLSLSSISIQKTVESKISLPEKVELKEDLKKQIPYPPENQNLVPQNTNSPLNSSKRFKNPNQKSIVDGFNVPKMNFIPIVNKDTTNSNTFDIEYLLNPEVQKLAKSCHRMTQSTTLLYTGSFIKTKDHSKKAHIGHSHFNSMSSKEIHSELGLSKSKKPSIDIEERFYNKAKKAEEKVKALKELKEMEELNYCTFKPQIKTKRKEKSYDEFYEYVTSFKEKKENKVKMIKEEEQKALEKSVDLCYKPKLCEKSLKIIARKGTADENTIEKLNKYYKCKERSGEKKEQGSNSKTETSRIVQTKLIKRSQNYHRTEPIDKFLYNDAMRRKNKETKATPQQTPKFITASSEKVLIAKLKREFEESFFNVDIDSTGEINYTRMIELFRQMSMIRNDSKREEERLLLLDAWRLISSSSNQVCDKYSLLVFILAIMGFYEDWMGQADEDRLVLTQPESKKLHKKFDLFYKNQSLHNKNPLNKSLKDYEDCSFHPHIGAISEHFYENSKSHRYIGKIEDHLLSQKDLVSKKIEEKRILIEELDMEECSFHPVIETMPESCKSSRNFDKEDLTTEYFKQLKSPDYDNKHRGLFLHDLSKVFKEKKQHIIASEKEKAHKKELELCTFTPHLVKRIFPGENLTEPAKKSEKIIKKKFETQKKNQLINPRKKPSVETQVEENREILETEESKEEDQREFFKVVSNANGIAKISINLGDNCEILDFSLETDDPASCVMAFSARFSLQKDQEYKLVKKLTLLKYTS